MKDFTEDIYEIISIIDSVSNLCYQQKKTEAMEAMNKLSMIETDLFNTFYFMKTHRSDFDFDDARMLSIMESQVSAMENHDLVMLADILQYDLKPELLEIAE